MIDHIELEAMAELFSAEDTKTRESPFDFKQGYIAGFAKAVHYMEVVTEKRNWEEMSRYHKADTDNALEERARKIKEEM